MACQNPKEPGKAFYLHYILMEKTRFFQVEYVAQMAEQGQPVANYLILTRECSKSLNKTSKNGAQNGKSAHRRAVLSRPDGEENEQRYGAMLQDGFACAASRLPLEGKLSALAD